MSIGQPGDLATGLQIVISDLSSRYVLGFSLDDRDYGDGRTRRLEVKVEAPEGMWPEAQTSSEGAQELLPPLLKIDGVARTSV